ncbi:alpha/beta fold hydrolase [Staphylococcus caprae]|uniref:thioesterase II family protein n=1 Tax=Staphylococcus TaxID=1279 RepID=UPI0008A8AD74|nr:alpha/beta fold hydrolase [Staphylococcus sp. HMSC62A08]OHS39738.1 hypothetical protein HMPREF3264_03630 [Staphylococcus sp. HMSC62A08]
MNGSVWFPYNTNKNYVDHRVFCFHHAGGNASTYFTWANKNYDKIEFCPVELPGHGSRINEEYEHDFDAIIKNISHEIASYDNVDNITLFGHSLGSLIAYEVTSLLEREYNVNVRNLIVAGREAPQCMNRHKDVHYFSDEYLVSELFEMGGTPISILNNNNLMDYFLPILRSDYMLHRNYTFKNSQVNCPIHVHYGTQDKYTKLSNLKKWGTITTNNVFLNGFEGNHFFPIYMKEDYVNILVEIINNS